MITTKNYFKDLSDRELKEKSNKLNLLMAEFNWVELSYTKQLIDGEFERRKLSNRFKNMLNKIFNGII